MLLGLHFYGLAAVPGLHFDEAWAFNHGARLASGELTLSAMSPYTMPWAHYWAALWLQVHPGLFSFRASQVALSLGGLGFLGLALRAWGKPAHWLPWAALALPGLLLNHRFAVELNGLHALCFGLLAWALATGRPLLGAAAWLLGTTGHLLFYPWGLALVAGAWLSGRALTPRERWALGLSGLLLSLFFWRVWLGVPEKGKATALLASGGLLVAHALWLASRPVQAPRWLGAVVLFVAAPFLANLLFFSEGSWSYAQQTGALIWEETFYLLFLALLPLGFFLYRGCASLPPSLRLVFLLGVIGLGAMMLKPAPRYFETALLAMAALLVLGWHTLPEPKRRWGIGALLLHACLLYPAYFLEPSREAQLRLGPYRDSSRDFLSKQELAQFLGGRGCSLSDIKSVDSRVGEALQALTRADWQVSRFPCGLKQLRIERRAEATGGRAPIQVGDFLLFEDGS